MSEGTARASISRNATHRLPRGSSAQPCDQASHQRPLGARRGLAKGHKMRGITPHALKLPEVNHAPHLSLDPACFRGLMANTTNRTGRMANLPQLTIELDQQLADQLRNAAREHGWTPELSPPIASRSISKSPSAIASSSSAWRRSTRISPRWPNSSAKRRRPARVSTSRRSAATAESPERQIDRLAP